MDMRMMTFHDVLEDPGVLQFVAATHATGLVLSATVANALRAGGDGEGCEEAIARDLAMLETSWLESVRERLEAAVTLARSRITESN